MWSGSNWKKAKEGIDFPDISAIIRVFVTVQQVCAFTALTVRKLGLEGKNPIGIADLEWIFARNCEGTEQLRVFEQKWFSMGRETSWRQRRRKMKKLLAMVLTVSMTAAMVGCGQAAETTETAAESTAVETVESTAAEETVTESTEESTAAEEAAGEVLSYADYVAADLDSEVTIESYVQAKQSWWEDKATVYTQDKDGAYFLYDMACSEEDYEKLVPGVKIRVTGYKSEWSGEVELMDATFEFVEGADEYIAPAVDVTDLLGTDELIDHQNQHVTFTDLTVEAAGQDADGNDVPYLYNWDGSGSEGDDLYFNVSSNGETYTFLV